MTKILFCHIFFAQAVIAQAVFAQDSTVEPDLSTAQDVSRPNTEAQTNDNPATSNRDAEDQVFVPSEEISEDAPVPFPVDI